MEKSDRKLNACIGLLVLILAGTGWADYLLVNVDSRVSVASIPATSRWIDTTGLEQTIATRREPGESNDDLERRHRDVVVAALRYFPCKETVR